MLHVLFFLILEDDIDAGRECVIKGLYICLNEDPEDLVQAYMVSVPLPHSKK